MYCGVVSFLKDYGHHLRPQFANYTGYSIGVMEEIIHGSSVVKRTVIAYIQATDFKPFQTKDTRPMKRKDFLRNMLAASGSTMLLNNAFATNDLSAPAEKTFKLN